MHGNIANCEPSFSPVKKRAGPPPERKPEGSIDVIGGENSRGM